MNKPAEHPPILQELCRSQPLAALATNAAPNCCALFRVQVDRMNLELPQCSTKIHP